MSHADREIAQLRPVEGDVGSDANDACTTYPKVTLQDHGQGRR